MERPSTPPSGARQPSAIASPPTPEVTRQIEINRLKAKALRDQREAALRASNGGISPATGKTGGYLATEDVRIPSEVAASRKRTYEGAPKHAVPASNRDGSKPAGPEGALRPAKNFAKFVDFNMSAMTDTKGGFLTTDDDPFGNLSKEAPRPGEGPDVKPKHMSQAEWERQQLLKNLQRQKAGPFEPGISVLDDDAKRKRCRECKSLEIDWVWEEVFGCAVCGACKDRFPEKYSLLTKTECREDYLLTEPELKDAELLPHLSRPNPHKSHWHDMMLFLRYQVEEYAFGEKWGSAEKLDAEFARREADKKRRKETKFKEKLLDLKRKTRTEAFMRQAAGDKGGPRKFGDAIRGGKHVHEWGRALENEEGMTVRTCTGCGMEVEELDL